jgi:cell division septal protein FtsQ
VFKVRKKKTRSRTRMALAFTFIIIVSAAYVLGWSSLFTVKQVVVVGAPNPSETFTIEHSVQLGGKMARLESHTLTKSLKKYTWLDHSSVTRNWLKGIVTVRVWTRTPIAQFENHLVDDMGVVFDLPSVDTSHLPSITGSNSISAKFAVSVLTGLPARLQSQVTGILVHGSDSAILSIKDPTLKRTLTVAWGDQTDMSLKVQVYQALIALPENSTITQIDLSAPHAPIVK